MPVPIAFRKLAAPRYATPILRVLGLLVLALVFWKGAHGFLPHAGIVAGVALFLAGDLYAQLYPTG